MNPTFRTPDRQPVCHLAASPVDGLSSEYPTRQEESQQKVLKDLSARVKDLLKESQRKNTHEHSEDILVLKKSNVELQVVIDQFKSKTSTLRAEQSPQVAAITSEVQSSQPVKESYLRNSRKQSKEQEQESSPSRAGLKREIMTAFNAAIEANEDKLQRQQNYISNLERRLAKLERLDGKIEALWFEREVKLQPSPRKVKNFSLRTPQVPGDCIEDPQPQLSPPDENMKEKPLFENPHNKRQQKQNSSEQYARLSSRFALLQEDHSLLQQRFEIEVESHAKSSFDRQSLQKQLQSLEGDSKAFMTKMAALQGRLQFSHEKYADLEIFLQSQRTRRSGKILPNAGVSFASELGSIANELRMCGVDRFRTVEGQIMEILIEKERLRREVVDLQAQIVDRCRFSCTHREAFLLKERVNELEKEKREYQQQLEKWERTQGGDSSNEGPVFQGRRPKLQCLQWPRLVHFCITSSLARLEDLRQQCKGTARP